MTDVMIPTYKPDEELLKILESLKEQTCKPDRIILINTEERYLEELFKRTGYVPDKELVMIRNIKKSEFDHGKTRAEAAGLSNGDIMIFMTQDAIPADRFFIENLIRPLKDERVAVSYARQLPKEGCSVEERYTREFNYPDKSVLKGAADVDRLGIKAYFCSNVSCAYRRDVYDRLGGFVKKTIFNEDMIYAAGAVKAGYMIAYSAEARVYHSHDYNAGEQFRRNVDIGISQAQYPEVFRGLSSEAEGKKLVLATMGELIHTKNVHRIPLYLVRIISRYCGYLTGKHYKRLPVGLIKRVSMNPGYFTEEKQCAE